MQRIFQAVFLIVAVIVIGTSGYMIVGIATDNYWSLLDCAYMTIITIATVGYGEIFDLSHNPAGRIYTIFLIFSGMGVLLYGMSTITAFIVEGDLTKVLWRKKMEKEIEKKRGHFIVCGAGSTGFFIIEELLVTGRDFVVIDKEDENFERIKKEGKFHYIIGDATDDDILLKAGIKHAKGIATALPDDKDNLFVTVTARELNKNIRIIAKVIDPQSRSKMIKAGADSVVSPNAIGGLRMVSEMVRPHVVTFLDKMLRERDEIYRFEEVKISERSKAIGKRLEEIGVYEEFGIPVLAIRESEGDDFIYNPGPDIIIKSDSTLVILASKDEVKRLKEYVGE
ncbi:MAG: hypothetical protein A3C43_04610 [Candidatus Schekmanbacteria bacterium RIFCSPHIGHO2_02_FULL_38_11]|nr:MAG: hypothetical protein A2043_09285 [Candidatus Schekmanbacteria bacterium GWA2_38_9]OGL50578.1 MAG: hypothetical protein A3H37_01865 [Candidatus Schekmanbacteria bacterium RIFCSPLOWO2_02_FULL_38_14]OGL52926.1 MAG: hypothetical protein A3C43_04610 [Candidatus Schekmanbacteria bacterium RIFCSPHIGHO2_02_FULL_38_11]